MKNTFFLTLITVCLMFVGCSENVDYKSQAQSTETTMANAVAKLKANQTKTERLFGTESDFLELYSENIPGESFQSAQKKVDDANNLYVRYVVPVLQGKNPSTKEEIGNFNKARSAVTNAAQYIEQNTLQRYNAAQKLVQARDRLPQMKESMIRMKDSVEAQNERGSAILKQACRECAFREDAIKSQYTNIESATNIFNRYTDSFESALEGDVINYVAVANAFEGAQTQSATIAQGVNAFISKVGELEKSYTKTLIDMRYQNNKYQHQYSIVNNGEVTTQWVDVNEAVYEKNLENMLMDLESKPLCYFQSEKTTAPAPAGMNMVGNPKYGNWKDKDGNSITEEQARSNPGNSFWHYYGQYMFWSNLMWGPNYRGGGYAYNDYGGYNTHRSRDRNTAYYGGSGSSRKYGSSGAVTKRSSTYSRASFGRSGGVASARSTVRSNKSARSSQSRSSSNRSRSGSSRRGGGSGRGGK
ncbi:MAG: hypothetical protein MRY57_04265 [Candidatus Pacebacteria bacterium]|nr:hypothetical protein [Candidatus Paceibacterota bacterium]